MFRIVSHHAVQASIASMFFRSLLLCQPLIDIILSGRPFDICRELRRKSLSQIAAKYPRKNDVIALSTHIAVSPLVLL
jgi:hypothetical protein